MADSVSVIFVFMERKLRLWSDEQSSSIKAETVVRHTELSYSYQLQTLATARSRGDVGRWSSEINIQIKVFHLCLHKFVDDVHFRDISVRQSEKITLSDIPNAVTQALQRKIPQK